MFSKIKTFLAHIILFPLALLLIFEEWGWVPLQAVFYRLTQTFLLWKRFENFVSSATPISSLFLLLVPMMTLMPLKFLGVYFIDIGHFSKGLGVIIFSKILGTAFFSRIFVLTRPNLLKLKWFAYFYPRWINWKNSLLSYVRSTWPWRTVHTIKRLITKYL